MRVHRSKIPSSLPFNTRTLNLTQTTSKPFLLYATLNLSGFLCEICVTYPVRVAVVATVLVLNLLGSEYPDESHERPGERRQQVEDDADLGDVLNGWKYQEN